MGQLDRDAIERGLLDAKDLWCDTTTSLEGRDDFRKAHFVLCFDTDSSSSLQGAATSIVDDEKFDLKTAKILLIFDHERREIQKIPYKD